MGSAKAEQQRSRQARSAGDGPDLGLLHPNGAADRRPEQGEVNVRIKVVGGSEMAASGDASGGVVAAESKLVGAHWVVLDKYLKQETKHCLEELQCSIVVMKGSHAKVLRLNLGGPDRVCPPSATSSSSSPSKQKLPYDRIKYPKPRETLSLGQHGTPVTRANTRDAFPDIFRETNPLFERFGNGKLSSKEDTDSEEDAGTSDSDHVRGRRPLEMGLRQDGGTSMCFDAQILPSVHRTAHDPNVHWIPDNYVSEETPSTQSFKIYNQRTRPPPTARKVLREEPYVTREHAYSSDVREAVSFFGSSPSNPPPLCSLCRHKAPLFGKPPRRFTYRELVEATDGFSDGNFLGDGRYGCVHRGILVDGQVVAVKQLKAVDDLRGNDEFHAEVESLSRAQHRNVVMLVGFCIEGRRRLLAYEYICNGSLDDHLQGREEVPLDWRARVKIAVGAARGLRYLHEDCRVGLVHGDLRANHILLTHDFEPMVGGFSLTNCQRKRSIVSETHVVDTFGYQAPECIEHGVVTEKADVYAFGVVLLEILSGRRALDLSQPKGKQLLTEWARPILSLALQGSHTVLVDQFLDPSLDRDQTHQFSSQLHAMYCAAFLCLHLDPQTRPNMSKVIKVFEGDAFVDPGYDFNLVGSKSSRMNNPMLEQDIAIGGNLSLRFPYKATTNSLHVERSWSSFHINS